MVPPGPDKPLGMPPAFCAIALPPMTRLDAAITKRREAVVTAIVLIMAKGDARQCARRHASLGRKFYSSWRLKFHGGAVRTLMPGMRMR
jgi:hypothetical protein